jgi:uncharacterized protein involved in copper resistance
MYRQNRPFLLTLLLLSIGLRTVFGAPCCMAWEAAAHAAETPMEIESHDHHGHHDHDGHAHHDHHAHHGDEHGSSDGTHSHEAHASASNPCCSACGPTLPPDTILLADRAQIKAPTNAIPIRALQTRPPFPAYDARGPPLLS